MTATPVGTVDPATVAALLDDLAALPADAWVARRQTGWWAVPLRAVDGDHLDGGYTRPGDWPRVTDTRWLVDQPAAAAFLARFAGVGPVRWMAMDSGARVAWHSDPMPTGAHRFHVPVIAAGYEVRWSSRVRQRLDVGCVWDFPATRRHAVSNTGPVTRVALVIDAHAVYPG